MSRPEHRDWEEDTLPTPRVPAEPPRPAAPGPSGSDTLEMPVVPADRRRDRPASGSRRTAPARPPGTPPRSRRRRRPLRLALLGLALVAAAGAGVLAGRLVPSGSDGVPEVLAASGSGDTAVEATWSSVDPVGGSGFRQVDGTTWRTQSYRTAQFGNLKPGVGLLADLGSPRELSSVSVDVAPVGTVVELRAGDSPSQDPEDYTVVASGEEASGPTELDASGAGAHRYWLVWVSELGPREGGFVAELSSPRVEA